MYDYLLKYIILGDEDIGKTSMIASYKNEITVEKTIAVDFQPLLLNYNNQKIKIYLYDTSGSQSYLNIIKSYFPNIVGLILCFDLNNKTSYENVLKWYNLFLGEKKTYFNVILVGLKSDLTRRVSFKDIYKLQEKLKCDYVEINKNSHKVTDVFANLTKNILSDYRCNMPYFQNCPGFQTNNHYDFQKNDFCNCNIL
jgi:small GTP-binding protein